MSVSRDDFSIAFRSALLTKRRSSKIFCSIFNLFSIIIFFLDVYAVKFTKPVRSLINDVVYRVTYLASAPTRLFPQALKIFQVILI